MHPLHLLFINIGFRALVLKQIRDEVHGQHGTSYILHHPDTEIGNIEMDIET